MSTIVVVKKGDWAVIAADTLTTFGSTKESAEYVLNSEKIIEYRGNFLGVTGSASLPIALEDILSKPKKRFSFDTAAEIFRAGLEIHRELKENYFLRGEGDEEDFETSSGDVLIANRRGIFGLSAYRYVQNFSKFYAYGSGSAYALGAMFAVYADESKSAEDVARVGVNAGIEFDDGSGAPFTVRAVKLDD